MAVIVAVASTAAPSFNVINFANNTPSSASVTGYGGGNVVDCYGVLAAVGDAAGASFTLYNLLTPSSPRWVSSIDTGLNSIMAIAISDRYVLACGMAPPNNPEIEGTDPLGTVVLVDISNPLLPSVVGGRYQPMGPGIPTSCAIRGTTGVVGGSVPSGTSVLYTIDYTNPAYPAGSPWDNAVTDNLVGPLLVDFDGTRALATTTGPGSGGSGNSAYVWNLSSGELPSQVGGGGAPAAVAEIPEGGYYLAVGFAPTAAGMAGSYGISAFPDGAPSAILNEPTLNPTLPSEATVVRFLNNPAIAPILAVANVTASGRMFVRMNFLVLETGDHSIPTTIQIATPVPIAQVMLPGTGAGELAVGVPPAGITLGITGLTPLSPSRPIPFPGHLPPHWPG